MEIEERVYYVVFRAMGKAKERLIELLLRGLPVACIDGMSVQERAIDVHTCENGDQL